MRNEPRRRRRSGRLSGRQLSGKRLSGQRLSGNRLSGQQLGDINSLSDLCERFGVPGIVCDCDAAASAISLLGKDVCDYQPFQAACGKKHSEMCQPETPPPPPGGYGGYQQAGMSTGLKLALGAAAGGTLLALISQQSD